MFFFQACAAVRLSFAQNGANKTMRRSRVSAMLRISCSCARARSTGARSTAMRKSGACVLAIAMVLAPLLASCAIARADAGQVRFARQLGLGYLQFYVMQDKQMVERRAEQAGLGKVTTVYSGMGTPTAIADALLSGNVDVIGVGLPVFLTLWDK